VRHELIHPIASAAIGYFSTLLSIYKTLFESPELMMKVVEQQAKPNSQKRELIRSMSSVFDFEDDEQELSRPPQERPRKFSRVIRTKELEIFTSRNLRGFRDQGPRESDEELPRIDKLYEELENFK